MTERIHTDGLPVDATPKITFYVGECQETENWDWEEAIKCARYMEIRARTAEADLAEMKARTEKAEAELAGLGHPARRTRRARRAHER